MLLFRFCIKACQHVAYISVKVSMKWKLLIVFYCDVYLLKLLKNVGWNLILSTEYQLDHFGLQLL